MSYPVCVCFIFLHELSKNLRMLIMCEVLLYKLLFSWKITDNVETNVVSITNSPCWGILKLGLYLYIERACSTITVNDTLGRHTCTYTGAPDNALDIHYFYKDNNIRRWIVLCYLVVMFIVAPGAPLSHTPLLLIVILDLIYNRSLCNCIRGGSSYPFTLDTHPADV